MWLFNNPVNSRLKFDKVKGFSYYVTRFYLFKFQGLGFNGENAGHGSSMEVSSYAQEKIFQIQADLSGHL